MVNDGDSALLKYNVELNLGDQRRVAREFEWNRLPAACRRLDSCYRQTALADQQSDCPVDTRGRSAAGVFSRQREYRGHRPCHGQARPGRQIGPIKTKINFNFGPKLVLYQAMFVLFAGGDRTMRSVDAATGKLLWTAPHDQSGYQSPEDLLVMQATWSGRLPPLARKTPESTRAADPRTGKIAQDSSHRMSKPTGSTTAATSPRPPTASCCLRERESSLSTRNKESWDIHHWVRGGCLYGIMPCNGLVYAPPHNCACYPEAKLYGLNVLAPATSSPPAELPQPLSDEQRLLRGEAFMRSATTAEGQGRHKPIRAIGPPIATIASRTGSGVESPNRASPTSAPAWQSQLQGRLTSVVVADGRLFVAEIDRHTLLRPRCTQTRAKRLWSRTLSADASTRHLQSHGPRVLFGSADGHAALPESQLTGRWAGASRQHRPTVD